MDYDTERTIDVSGKPCPVPVIEAKKALAENTVSRVSLRVDNFAAVQNLEKMASGCGYGFSHSGNAEGSFDVVIVKQSDAGQANAKQGVTSPSLRETEEPPPRSPSLAVVISRDTMGEGAEELGRILIKGFIYALSELRDAPDYIIFLNSGATLTSEGASTIGDLERLVTKGTKVLTCGTCVGYYALKEPAVGEVADLYRIAEVMTNADRLISI